jgi:hypothetical protein
MLNFGEDLEKRISNLAMAADGFYLCTIVSDIQTAHIKRNEFVFIASIAIKLLQTILASSNANASGMRGSTLARNIHLASFQHAFAVRLFRNRSYDSPPDARLHPASLGKSCDFGLEV